MNADPNPTKALFLEAVERHAPDQGPALLDRACTGQPDLGGLAELGFGLCILVARSQDAAEAGTSQTLGVDDVETFVMGNPADVEIGSRGCCPDLTCWTMIRAAAGGDPAARERFGRVYQPVVHAYLAARWKGQGQAAAHDLDDACQDVFVECFRAGGLLEKVDADRPGGFRAFLLGAARNVARRQESRKASPHQLPDDIICDETGPAEAFDRAWARALLREAARVQEMSASESDSAALRRVQLLRLRFHDGLPIREIARRWTEDPVKLHHEYATAREEFRLALQSVVAFHLPGGTPADIERACAELLQLLA